MSRGWSRLSLAAAGLRMRNKGRLSTATVRIPYA